MVFPTWTITIECFFRDGPLISMVFQWFSWILVQWSAMVLASKKPKIAQKLWHILFCYHCAYYFRIREHKMLHFTIPHHVSLPISKLQGVFFQLGPPSKVLSSAQDLKFCPFLPGPHSHCINIFQQWSTADLFKIFTGYFNKITLLSVNFKF